MKKPKFLDERTLELNGRVSFYVLMLTWIALAGLVVYKRYFLHQELEGHFDISMVLLGSMVCYWGARLFLSGILPVIAWKSMLGIYLAAVTVISVPSALIHGLPTAENWTNTILPAALGPAVVLLVFWLIAYFGKRRLEKALKE